MARDKIRNTRSFPIWPGMGVDEAMTGVTVDATGYSKPVALAKGGNATIHLDVTSGLTGVFTLQL